jgi:hypothetical protein
MGDLDFSPTLLGTTALARRHTDVPKAPTILATSSDSFQEQD